MKEDRRAVSQGQLGVELEQGLLEEAGRLGKLFDPLVIREELCVVVTQGEDAARL